MIVVLASLMMHAGHEGDSVVRKSWRVSEVEAWVQTLGSATAVEAVRRNAVDGKTLAKVDFKTEFGLPRALEAKLNLSVWTPIEASGESANLTGQWLDRSAGNIVSVVHRPSSCDVQLYMYSHDQPFFPALVHPWSHVVFGFTNFAHEFEVVLAGTNRTGNFHIGTDLAPSSSTTNRWERLPESANVALHELEVPAEVIAVAILELASVALQFGLSTSRQFVNVQTCDVCMGA